MPHFPPRQAGTNPTLSTPSEEVFCPVNPRCVPPPVSAEERDAAGSPAAPDLSASRSPLRPAPFPTRGGLEVFHATLLGFSPLASRPHADDRAFSEAGANEAAAFVIREDNDRVQFSQQQILPGEMPSDLSRARG